MSDSPPRAHATYFLPLWRMRTNQNEARATPAGIKLITSRAPPPDHHSPLPTRAHNACSHSRLLRAELRGRRARDRSDIPTTLALAVAQSLPAPATHLQLPCQTTHLLRSSPHAPSRTMPAALVTTEPDSQAVLTARRALARAREAIAEGANPFADSELRRILSPTADPWTSPAHTIYAAPTVPTTEIYLRTDSGTRSTGNLAPWVALLICGSQNVVMVRLEVPHSCCTLHRSCCVHADASTDAATCASHRSSRRPHVRPLDRPHPGAGALPLRRDQHAAPDAVDDRRVLSCLLSRRSPARRHH